RRPTTPDRVAPIRFGLLPVRSPLLGESLLMSFPRGTEMFQFPRFASPPYEFRERSVGITPRGFPHSGIRGSRPACGSPRLFAACHALRRFLAPRHPPSALPSLTTDRSSAVRRMRLLVQTLWLLEDLVCGCQRAARQPRRGWRKIMLLAPAAGERPGDPRGGAPPPLP